MFSLLCLLSFCLSIFLILFDNEYLLTDFLQTLHAHFSCECIAGTDLIISDDDNLWSMSEFCSATNPPGSW